MHGRGRHAAGRVVACSRCFTGFAQGLGFGGSDLEFRELRQFR